MTQDEHAQAIINAGDRLAEAHVAVERYVNGRAAEKWAAVNRLVQYGTMTSLSQAEKYARKDAEYDAYCEQQAVAEAALIKARAYYDACTARARVAA